VAFTLELDLDLIGIRAILTIDVLSFGLMRLIFSGFLIVLSGWSEHSRRNNGLCRNITSRNTYRCKNSTCSNYMEYRNSTRINALKCLPVGT
jgi:hypothetical protein